MFDSQWRPPVQCNCDRMPNWGYYSIILPPTEESSYALRFSSDSSTAYPLSPALFPSRSLPSSLIPEESKTPADLLPVQLDLEQAAGS